MQRKKRRVKGTGKRKANKCKGDQKLKEGMKVERINNKVENIDLRRREETRLEEIRRAKRGKRTRKGEKRIGEKE